MDFFAVFKSNLPKNGLSPSGLTTPLSILWLVIGGIICSFGQPAWSPFLSMLAAAGGYACVWRVTAQFTHPGYRFAVGALWFSVVQLVQLSWLVAHPYLYIYLIYVLFAAALGLQFGLLCLLITPRQLQRLSSVFAIAGIWVILEWMRLFALAGFSFNPIGLALTAHPYSLQLAGWGGIFLLSFWVIVTSLLLLRCWLWPGKYAALLWLVAALLPYILGGLQWHHHFYKQKEAEAHSDNAFWHVLALQTAFPCEESQTFADMSSFFSYITEEWNQVAELCAPYAGKQLDIVVLPEGVVPFDAYSLIHSYDVSVDSFKNAFGDELLKYLPTPHSPFAGSVRDRQGNSQLLVNHAFWVQGLANILNAPVIAGLEDSEWTANGTALHYSAALYFIPQQQWQEEKWPPSERYAKRILVPLGEYIPFTWCQNLARAYNVTSSFVHGDKAGVFKCGSQLISPSICYEETFGHLMREGRQQGASLLVNLTNDGWYPHSKLPEQHRDHARLRTVENGVPLVRACNTGITTAIDSLGTTLGELLEEDGSGVLYAELPRYHYRTVYTDWGDWLVLLLCSLSISVWFFSCLRGNRSR